ncbi:CBR2 [Symbiodinium natans]|uniref:cytochrome-b5 reductase n=1 Tax=Symbiodinium natans TaxID=878477 RepID=A0A812U0Y2_9DINO|nr:CBR2 [Symbiodinium natans]
MRGALVQQLGVASDQRLRYVKISGEGPEHGWVSLQASGKQLLKKVDAIVTAMLCVRSLRNPASILCIGDSLTAGGYPALLQNLLTVDSGVPAVVTDFGVRGASVLPMPGGPCVAYSSLVRLDAELHRNPPDAVVIMLGTNDARTGHWDAEAFQTEYRALLHRLGGLELEDGCGSRRLVLIAVPPRVTSNAWGIDVGIAETDLPLAVQAVSERMGMPLINLREVLEPIDLFVSDGVHLSQVFVTCVPSISVKVGMLRKACLLRFAVPGGKPLGGYDRSAPTGVKVQMADGEGSILEKSYSPISHPAQVGFFDLLVRSYPPRPGGGLGAYLCGLKPGQSALMKVKPESFSIMAGAPLRPGRFDHLGLVAAGTGLAPLLQVAVEALSWRDGTRVSLILACRTQAEILMREELEKLAASPAVNVWFQLSRPGPDWPAERSGRLSKAVLEQCLPSPDSRCMILVCGTDGFVESMAGPIERIKLPEGGKRKMQGKLGGLLAELGYAACQVHKF